MVTEKKQQAIVQVCWTAEMEEGLIDMCHVTIHHNCMDNGQDLKTPVV